MLGFKKVAHADGVDFNHLEDKRLRAGIDNEGGIWINAVHGASKDHIRELAILLLDIVDD